MERRTYLRGLGGAGLVGVAGCLDRLAGDDGDSRTILSPEEAYPSDPPYPSHGDEFPSFSIPDPISETTVSLEDFVGERPFLMTYFFTSCPDGACPALLLRLRWIQEDAAEQGYADDIGLLAVTFDPERDTPDALRKYATDRNIDYEADNWHFLRPETYEEAETVMEETFGMVIQKVDDADHAHGDGNETTDEGTEGEQTSEAETNDAQSSGNETEHDDHDHGEYTFNHNNRVTLVNEDGIVERAYPKAVLSDMSLERETLVEDTRRVVGVE